MNSRDGITLGLQEQTAVLIDGAGVNTSFKATETAHSIAVYLRLFE